MTTKEQYIERWEEALRVLEGMTLHERKHHFDMTFWGMETSCGTVACLAGHCSLDPWFRRRKFTSKLVQVQVIGDQHQKQLFFDKKQPKDFFGILGHERIFLTESGWFSYRRVVAEVKRHIADLKKGVNPNMHYREYNIKDVD